MTNNVDTDCNSLLEEIDKEYDPDTIKVEVTAMTMSQLVSMIERLKTELYSCRVTLKATEREYDEYRKVEVEREKNAREKVETEYASRIKIVEYNERKSKAYSDYLSAKGVLINHLYGRMIQILTKKQTKMLDDAIKEYHNKQDMAWENYDKVQMEVPNGI